MRSILESITALSENYPGCWVDWELGTYAKPEVVARALSGLEGILTHLDPRSFLASQLRQRRTWLQARRDQAAVELEELDDIKAQLQGSWRPVPVLV